MAENYIKFLGTAGARFVMLKQLRSSGGIWLSYEATNIVIDPGPGALVRCAMSKPKLDPMKLDGIILTHRHLDHSGDLNVMIEAMTEGGFKKRGKVFLPKDAIGRDSAVLKHLRKLPEEMVVLEEKKRYRIGDINFEVPSQMKHSVKTFGLRFHLKETVSLVSDTDYFKGLEKLYKADVLIINVVFFLDRPQVEHLCLNDAKAIIKAIRPKAAILTHFGMTMLQRRPHMLAQDIGKELGVDVAAAYDGMKFNLT